MILLAALVVIYLLNFKYIQAMGDGGIISARGLYFANLALAGFVVSAISVRFVFPMVSLEGRAFWLIQSAPIKSHDFLTAKWRAAVVPIWAFGQLLTISSNLMLGVEPGLIASALVFQTPAILGVVGLGIGLGARFPRFNVDQAAQVAVGLGGFIYMMSGLAVVLVSLLLSVQPILLLDGLWRGEAVGAGRIALAAVLAVSAMGLPLLVGYWQVRRGGRNLATSG
jgi:ABC-2 type transport system permease protein